MGTWRRRAVVRWEKALRRAVASLAQGRHLVVDWTRKHLQVIVWLVVAGLSAIGTWIALPAGITNLANGTSAKAQAPKGISISGVDTDHISYHVDLDRDDAGSATGYLLIYYTAGSNPTATLSPRLGYCSVPTGVETPLPVDRESPNNEGSISCNYVPLASWTSTSTSTTVSPDISVDPSKGGTLNQVSVRIRSTIRKGRQSASSPSNL